jgi:hypothetical protein
MPKIIRYEKDSDYTEVNNYMLTDKNLSFSAKGLLAYMLHNNAQWRYYICKLKEVSTDGETKISSIKKEIEKSGKDGEFGKDEEEKYLEELQNLVTEANRELEEMYSKKEKDVLGE